MYLILYLFGTLVSNGVLTAGFSHGNGHRGSLFVGVRKSGMRMSSSAADAAAKSGLMPKEFRQLKVYIIDIVHNIS
jgi:hypothetical protein